MKNYVLVCLLALLLAAPSASSIEWKGKMGAGVRGLGTGLLFNGSDFSNWGGEYQPFEMGYKIGLEARYGFTRNLTASFSMGYANTYDDTTETSNQTFKWRDPDNAFVHLRGKLYSLTASYYFRPEEKLQPFGLLGLGIDHWRIRERRGWDTHTITDLSLKFGGGLNYWLYEFLTVDLQLKFSYGLANLKSEVPEDFYGPGDWTEWNTRPYRGYVEPSLGVTLYLGGAPDEDDDGVKDADDQCPGTPKGAVVAANGCPVDTDGDGVYDGLDLCPDTPQGVTVDANGCPLDSDGDGVFDSFDQCPDTPTGVAVDDKGCPFDTDGDGVPDHADKCPDTPRGADVDSDGCPMDTDGDGVFNGIDECPNSPAGSEVDITGCPPDRDGDGVLYVNDQCPDTPENIPVDAVGCPVARRITAKITLSGSVSYAPGKYDLTDSAKTVLDDVAARMQAWPNVNITVSGFADPSGAADFNLSLSENRARAVTDYLVSKGIEGGRMTARGFGEDPQYFIAPNDKPEGMAKNRRVEIEAVE